MKKKKNFFNFAVGIRQHKILGFVLKEEPNFFEKFKTWKPKETQSQKIFCKFFKTSNNIMLKKDIKTKRTVFLKYV